MNQNIVPGSFVAVSDFHSYQYPLEKVKNYYLNEYEKIYILGDITDRGEDKKGSNGLSMLQEVKQLSEQYPDRIIYVPGNHDQFVYNYGKHNYPYDDYYVNAVGASETFKDIEKLKKTNPKQAEELMDWLGNLPLQQVHGFDGKIYVFAHAFFNQDVYLSNPKFSLETLYQHQQNSGYTVEPIIWFRKDRDSYDKKQVPANVIEVIGHTPQRDQENDLDLENCEGTYTKVVCVDGGIAFGYDMLKYDGDDCINKTLENTHNDTSPKINITPLNDVDDEEITEEDIKTLKDAIKETTLRHGLNHVKYSLVLALAGDDYSIEFFSKGNREKLRKVGLDKISKMLTQNTDTTMEDEIATEYLNEICQEDKEFSSYAYCGNPDYNELISNAMKQLHPDYEEISRESKPKTTNSKTYRLKKSQIIQDNDPVNF